jgi:hypothetical protein
MKTVNVVSKVLMENVRIRVRIGPSHPLASSKINGVALRMRPEKTETPCHSRYGTMETLPAQRP